MKVVNKWNRFIELMIATKKAWDDLREIVTHSPEQWDKLSPMAQKILTIANRKSKFEIAMPRLMNYWRGYGGVETLRISVQKENQLFKAQKAAAELKEQKIRGKEMAVGIELNEFKKENGENAKAA